MAVPVELTKGVLEAGGALPVEHSTARAAHTLMDEAALLPADEARRDDAQRLRFDHN